MNAKNRIYPAKLLLFGEHTVIVGSSALAIPFPKYFMKWVHKKEDHPVWLKEYIAFLERECHDFINISRLQEWKEDHTIEANIPIGYGLGSSGALTAAIYDIAGANGKSEDLDLLQYRFGKMESFFHGKSSGFDPLVSYIQKPILKTNSGLSILENESIRFDFNCYLLDSGCTRQGKGTITRFLEKYNQENSELNDLLKLNSTVVKSILESKENVLAKIEKISILQFNHMDFMILNSIKAIWKEGLASNSFFLKICGAGGGGYYFVFSKNELESLDHFKIEKVDL